MSVGKEKKWFRPLFEFEDTPHKKPKNATTKDENFNFQKKTTQQQNKQSNQQNTGNSNASSKNWMKNFDPVDVEDLAVHSKKVQEVDEWLKGVSEISQNNILLLSGPVGTGKTATVHVLAAKYKIKVTEWITPLDIEYPSDFGDYEFKESQSKKFMEFLINSANFTSLLDNNNRKIVMVEDFPNTFLRSPKEFTEVLQHYKIKAKSPVVFICSESHTENKNTALNLFSSSLKEQFNIHHIMFNAVSATGLRGALKRVADVISKKYSSAYNIPKSDLIESVVNTSGGDIRSAILNLHFASLKGSNFNLETSIMKEKETKTKRKKKNAPNKFLSLGKDQTVSILHGVGRVLNPKVIIENGCKTMVHVPKDVIEQFLSNPMSFVNFLEENYLPHFSCIYDANKATLALSDSDYMLAEWREKMCQEYGLYVAVAGLMLANKSPVSAWNPVRGPKNMRIKYPSQYEMPLLEPNHLYKGKVLVADYVTYCKIIGSTTKESSMCDVEINIE